MENMAANMDEMTVADCKKLDQLLGVEEERISRVQVRRCLWFFLCGTFRLLFVLLVVHFFDNVLTFYHFMTKMKNLR